MTKDVRPIEMHLDVTDDVVNRAAEQIRAESEDCISREHLKSFGYINKGDFNSVETIREWIDNAPSVIPKEKEGEWIESPYENADGMTMYRCSECGCLCEGGYNYCFKCGAKMRDNNVESD